MTQTYDLSDELMSECAQLVYRQWTIAFDNLKAVKAEKPNLKLEPDWEQFHKIRLENAQKDYDKWDRLRKEITPLSPLVRAYNAAR